jgi:two-component system response regulator PilR (NtrC family)
MIIEALDQTRWNRTKAAELLGMSFRQLRYRIQKYELDTH